MSNMIELSRFVNLFNSKFDDVIIETDVEIIKRYLSTAQSVHVNNNLGNLTMQCTFNDIINTYSTQKKYMTDKQIQACEFNSNILNIIENIIDKSNLQHLLND